MEDQGLFGNYSISSRVLKKLKPIKDALQEDIYKADRGWLIIGRKIMDSSSDSDESGAMEVEEIVDSMYEDQLPSTQFFFTQIDKNNDREDIERASLQICDIIEVLYEGLERNGKLDFIHLENLSNNELIQVFIELGEKLSVEGTYNLCSLIKNKDPEEGIKYMSFICTHVLLPKIIKLEESSRLISSAIGKCVEKFPDEIIKFIFIPVLNVDLKDASIISVIIDSLQSSKRSTLISEYVTNAKELKEWHMPILETLLSVKIEQNAYDKILKLFSEKAVLFSTNKRFGKLILSFLKANSITSEEQKDLLFEIVEVNETLFKKLIENILKKIASMAEELSGVTIVIFIAAGVLTILLLFIFAKRQIMRFALRSRRGPHIPIGHDAKKSLKREIERRIEVIPRIQYEPQLISDSRYILTPGSQAPPHYYRLKAVDDIKTLEAEITKYDSCLKRHPSENLRAYLLSTLATPLNGSGQRMIHQFCDLYEHARHDPTEFGDEEYQVYTRLFLKLMDAARLLKSYPSSKKSSPSRTPIKKNVETKRNILEPRMRMPEDQVLTGSRPSTLTVMTLDNSETSV